MHIRYLFMLLVSSLLVVSCARPPSSPVPFQPVGLLTPEAPLPTSPQTIAQGIVTLSPPTAVPLTLAVPTVTPVATAQPSKPPATGTAELASPTPTPLKTYLPHSPLQGVPLDKLYQIVADPYHPPPPGWDDRHQGVDFAFYRQYDRPTIEGMGVETILPGRVAAALADTFPFGNFLIVETPAEYLPVWLQEKIGLQAEQSLYILFAHMGQAPELKIGDWVDAGQLVNVVGKSGNTVNSHLHIETRLGPAGATFEIFGNGSKDSPEERANYILWRTSGTFTHFDPMTLLLAKEE